MFKFFCYQVILAVTVVTANAQNDINVMNFKNQTNYIPPSPNAAALAKYSEIPVGLHTGIPQIGVPVYAWKSKRGNSTLDVSLSYHAGGIKVEDVASSTGTGWALNAGGTITRTVRGLPDDDIHGYINTDILSNYNTSVYNGGYYLNPPALANEYISMNISPLNIIAHFNDPNPDNGITREVYTGFRDSEQDMFYYNINGFVGKFVLDKDGVINKIDVNDLEINVQYFISGGIHPMKTIQYFTIQADDGIKYIFDVVENSTVLSVSSVDGYSYTGGPLISTQNPTPFPKTCASSYHVSKAIDLNSPDTIYYYYSSRALKYIGGWNEATEYYENDDPLLIFFGGTQSNNKISSHTYSYSYNENATKHINKIVLPDKTVVNFYYDQSRVDLQGDTALTRIEITDVAGNSKKLRLRYSYFNSVNTVINPAVNVWNTGPGGFPGYNYTPDHVYKRLRLDNVQQVTAWAGGDSILINQYQYNDTILPPRSSKEIDQWGYYYGPKRYAYTLIPQITPAIPENPQNEGLQPFNMFALILNAFTSGANRTPDFSYARASILKKIILPTGGYTGFQFETNTIKEAIYPNSNHGYFTVNSSQNQITSHKFFEMPGRSLTEVMFYINFSRVNADGSPYIPPPDTGGPYACFAEAVSMSQINFYVKSTDNTVFKQCNFNGVDVGDGSVKIFFSLPLGKTYYLYYTYNLQNDPCLNNAYFKFEANGKYITNNSSNPVGGLRIAAVNYFDPVASTTMKTMYNYNGDDGLSSGMLPAIPNNNHYVHAVGKWTCCDESCDSAIQVFLGYAQFKVRSSNSTQTLGYTSGSNAGYSKVTFSKVNSLNETLGKTVTYFTGIDLRNQHEVYPYKVNQLIDWASGHKWREYIYDKDNIVLRRTDFTYNDQVFNYNTEKNRSVKMACIRTDNCAGVNPIPFARYVANTYYPYYGKSLLMSKREAEFSNGDSLVLVTNYGYYFNTSHVAGITVSNNSKGQKQSSVYHYPQDYTNTAMQKLVANKVKGIPVSLRTFILLFLLNTPDREIKGEGVDYNIYGGYARPNKFFKLASVDAGNNSSFNPAFVKQSLDEVVGEITLYDAYGNACEYKGKDGVIQSIIWGYNYTVPVAKITGMSYNNAIAQLSTVTITGIQAITDDNTLRSKLNEIRQAYAGNTGVQVSTFTSKPLIGTTSETDVNGRTTYYEYDDFGRLILVRDNENKIIKKICYNYAGQVGNCGGSVGLIPCNATSCTGPDKKCINGNCETGIKECFDSHRLASTSWLNTYYYYWSDGSVSQNYTEIDTAPCLLLLPF